MAVTIDVRAGLAAELKRLVRDERAWPITDRRRFRNLLLDAVTSDAMPLTELLLRVYDDGMLQRLPVRTADRASWEVARSRMAADLQALNFLEPGVARFVADAWINALGPDPSVAPPRSTVRANPVARQPLRATPLPPAARPATAARTTAASVQNYRRTNALFATVAVLFVVGMILALRSTARDRPRPSDAVAVRPPEPARDSTANLPALRAPAPVAAPESGRAPANRSDTARATEAPPRAPVEIAPATERSSDDIVLKAGRVLEARVLSVRQQSVLVRDMDSGLDFEIAKSDIDRIITSEGRSVQFGEDNIPSLGSADGRPAAFGGRSRVRYSLRWGADAAPCTDMARDFAPGTDVVIRHLRGAPMLKFEFVGGQEFNAAVRSDGLFETVIVASPRPGPAASQVQTRISGRLARGGGLRGVARLIAVTNDGQTLCDLALTMQGAPVP